ncbi:hypothetical protein DL762_008033 [Monosporascus cannonballus]|uniref:F-box domain-containing protein n=1 Tax=Monosporascus cannonballus TaxID=155416 RepID=A0ABY0GYB9_9PEZI|nr:hypothetical protein DL762_008033 [Monosporascus cannonballus]
MNDPKIIDDVKRKLEHLSKQHGVDISPQALAEVLMEIAKAKGHSQHTDSTPQKKLKLDNEMEDEPKAKPAPSSLSFAEARYVPGMSGSLLAKHNSVSSGSVNPFAQNVTKTKPGPQQPSPCGNAPNYGASNVSKSPAVTTICASSSASSTQSSNRFLNTPNYAAGVSSLPSTSASTPAYVSNLKPGLQFPNPFLTPSRDGAGASNLSRFSFTSPHSMDHFTTTSQSSNPFVNPPNSSASDAPKAPSVAPGSQPTNPFRTPCHITTSTWKPAAVSRVNLKDLASFIDSSTVQSSVGQPMLSFANTRRKGNRRTPPKPLDLSRPGSVPIPQPPELPPTLTTEPPELKLPKTPTHALVIPQNGMAQTPNIRQYENSINATISAQPSLAVRGNTYVKFLKTPLAIGPERPRLVAVPEIKKLPKLPDDRDAKLAKFTIATPAMTEYAECAPLSSCSVSSTPPTTKHISLKDGLLSPLATCRVAMVQRALNFGKAKLPESGRFNLIKELSGTVELITEVCKHLTPADIVNLYCVSRDFHTTVNTYLQSSLRQWTDFMAPGAADIFKYQQYSHLCTVDPAGRKEEDAVPDSLTSRFARSGLDHSQIYSHLLAQTLNNDKGKGEENAAAQDDNGKGETVIRGGDGPKSPEKETRWVPTLKWFQMAVTRTSKARDILAHLARSGLRTPKHTLQAVLKLWLVTDIPTNAGRAAMMRAPGFLTDEDLVCAQIFLVKLALRFTDPGYGPCDTALLELVLGQRGGFEVLWHMLFGRAYRTAAELLRLKVRHDFVLPQGRELVASSEDGRKRLMGVPEEEIGRGCLEGWGKGIGLDTGADDKPKEPPRRLWRPDQLVITEAVRRHLGLEKHLMHHVMWGNVDPVTGRNLVPQEDELYMSDSERKNRAVDTSREYTAHHCAKDRWDQLSDEEKRRVAHRDDLLANRLDEVDEHRFDCDWEEVTPEEDVHINKVTVPAFHVDSESDAEDEEVKRRHEERRARREAKLRKIRRNLAEGPLLGGVRRRQVGGWNGPAPFIFGPQQQLPQQNGNDADDEHYDDSESEAETVSVNSAFSDLSGLKDAWKPDSDKKHKSEQQENRPYDFPPVYVKHPPLPGDTASQDDSQGEEEEGTESVYEESVYEEATAWEPADAWLDEEDWDPVIEGMRAGFRFMS